MTVVGSVVVIALAPSIPVLIMMNITLGLGQSLSGVTMGPFLLENSTDKERVYLFSFSSGLQTGSAFVGNWIGGYLPTWMGSIFHASATSTLALWLSHHYHFGGGGFGSYPVILTTETKEWLYQPGKFHPPDLLQKELGCCGQVDPAHAGDFDWCRVDHALHERLLPNCSPSIGPGDRFHVRLGISRHGHRVADCPCFG